MKNIRQKYFLQCCEFSEELNELYIYIYIYIYYNTLTITKL